jgi:hypothetical protein
MAPASTKSELFKIVSVVATIPACFLIFSGGFVLARYGVAHSARDLVVFGLLPLIGGICWLVLAAWFWSRGTAAKSFWDSVGVISLRVLVALVLAGIGVMALQKMRGH